VYPLTLEILSTIVWPVIHQKIPTVQVLVLRNDQSLPDPITVVFFHHASFLHEILSKIPDTCQPATKFCKERLKFKWLCYAF
jgi:hypothetical protein